MSPREIHLRSQKHIYLIVTEGETEKLYFEGMKEGFQRDVRSRIRILNPNDTDLSSLIKFSCDQISILDLDLDGGDRLFLVADHPIKWTKEMQKWIKEAQRRGIEIIITRPCFELWFLLHQGPFNRSMSAKEIIPELKKYIPKYRKADPQIYQKLKSRTDEAIRNGRRIEYDINNVKNPSIGVHVVVEFLIGMVEKEG